jgi:hypothetical protein
MNEEKNNWRTTVLGAISVFENPEAPEDGKAWAKHQLIKVGDVAEERDNWKEVVKMYINYDKTSKDEIQKHLRRIKLLLKRHNGPGTKYGYYFLGENAVVKLMNDPRGNSLNFDATEVGDYAGEDWKEIKKIIFLVKSSSRFFLKADIGEVFDQMDWRDIDKVDAIYVNLNAHETLPESQGEHFIMEATLLAKSI